MFRLTTLSENTGISGGIELGIPRSFLAEWGLSIMIETDGLNVLLDTGKSISATHNADTLGIDQVLYAITLLLCVEMGTTSPPYGLSLFVMKAVAPPDTTMGDIYRSALPFLGCDLIALISIMIFPPLTGWLPALIR